MKEEDLTLRTLLADIKKDVREQRNKSQDQYETITANQFAQKEVIKQLTTRVSDIQDLLIKGQNGEKPLVYTVRSLSEDSMKFKTAFEEVEKTTKNTKKELDALAQGSTITPVAVRTEQWKIIGAVAAILTGGIVAVVLSILGINS